MVSLKATKAYLDANTIIYALEGLDPHLRTHLLASLDAGEFSAVTSQLSLLETIIGPRKRGDAATEQEFRSFLADSTKLHLEPVTMEVLEKALEIRSRYSVKTPDAIHLATGMLMGDLFVSADKGWGKLGVSVVAPHEIG